MAGVIRNSFLVLLILSLTGCYYSSFSLDEEKLRMRNGRINWDFDLSKITVLDVDDSGLPVEYENDTILTMRFQGTRPLKSIYFYQKNEGYYWDYFNIPNFEKFETCPLKFQIGSWYRIAGLQKGSIADYEIFFKVLQDGTFEQYDQHIKVSPF